MNISFFIKKELAELKQCKKIMLMLIFAIFYQLLLNLVAKNPMVPLEEALLLFSFINAGISAELIYIIMVEEFKIGTFDIILLSKCKLHKLIFAKVLIATGITLVAVVFGIIVNNAGALFFDKVVAINNMGIIEILMIILAIVIYAMSALFSMINSKKYDNKSLTINIAIVGVGFVALYYVRSYIGNVMTFVMLAVIVIFLYMGILHGIHNRCVNDKRRKRIYLSFSKKDCNWFRCVVKRELIKIFERKAIVLKILFLIISSVCINSSFTGDMMYRKVLVFVEIFMLQSVFVMDIYFELAKQEVYAKMDDILILAGISKKKNLLMILGISIILGALCGSLFFVVNHVAVLCNGCGLMFGHGDIIFYFVILLLCNLVSWGVVLKFLKSIKEERIVKIFTYVLCVVVALVCYIR